MIQRLNSQLLSFQGKAEKSPREGYESQIKKNDDTARQEVISTMNVVKSIPMQGTGEKLDIIA